MFSSRLYEVIEHVSSRCHPNQDLDASPAPGLAVWPPVNYVMIVVFGSLILKIKTTAAHFTHLSCRWNGCAWRWGSSSLHHRSQFWNWSDHTGPRWKGGHTAEVSTTWQALGCVFAMAASMEGAVHLKQAIQQLHEAAGEALSRAGQGDGPSRTWPPGTAGL